MIKNIILYVFLAFYTNPQYKVSIAEPDDDDEDGNGTIVVGVMQKNRRKLRQEGQDNNPIGYAIYAVREMIFYFVQTQVQANNRSP